MENGRLILRGGKNQSLFPKIDYFDLKKRKMAILSSIEKNKYN